MLSIFSTVSGWVNSLTEFVEKNWVSPWFWLVAFLGLLALGLLIVSKFADN